MNIVVYLLLNLILAPEVHTGKKYTKASDYYSLGVLIYQLYTGKVF